MTVVWASKCFRRTTGPRARDSIEREIRPPSAVLSPIPHVISYLSRRADGALRRTTAPSPPLAYRDAATCSPRRARTPLSSAPSHKRPRLLACYDRLATVNGDYCTIAACQKRHVSGDVRGVPLRDAPALHYLRLRRWATPAPPPIAGSSSDSARARLPPPLYTMGGSGDYPSFFESASDWIKLWARPVTNRVFGARDGAKQRVGCRLYVEPLAQVKHKTQTTSKRVNKREDSATHLECQAPTVPWVRKVCAGVFSKGKQQVETYLFPQINAQLAPRCVRDKYTSFGEHGAYAEEAWATLADCMVPRLAPDSLASAHTSARWTCTHPVHVVLCHPPVSPHGCGLGIPRPVAAGAPPRGACGCVPSPHASVLWVCLTGGCWRRLIVCRDKEGVYAWSAAAEQKDSEE
ncbi:hypothetical protein C8J57DRAFT_1480156 [Mycena rebaudengoi]|nr:hypothetical protein C8J57DRAFT_1480156 [Mycena rebaudengoi]